MARLDDLIEHVPDKALRKELQSAVATLKRGQKFGLVFEEHIPETTTLTGIPVRVGSLVQRRESLEGGAIYRVVSIAKGTAELELTDDRERVHEGEHERLPVKDLLVLKRFGEPIYPALRPLAQVTRGDASQPYHTVINGENFHALQLLAYLLEGRVDCIYIDPPYNTGARDWKYNNRFVDKNDTWRHSKWLSMMQKRLKLAKRLLKPNGVLIVLIDENEVHHLGMMLEHIFNDARMQMVTICVNPSGASGEGLSRVDEYAFFCFLGNAEPVPTADDMLTGSETPSDQYKVRWEALMRGGNAWYRASRKNLCYPILLDDKREHVVGVGKPFEGSDESRRPRTINGHSVAWPVRLDGKLGIWRVDGARLMDLVGKGYAYVSSADEARGTWTIRYLMDGTVKLIESGDLVVTGRGERGQVVLTSKIGRKKIAKTVWHRGRHTAGGAGGTHLLATFLARRDVFDFPKSVYAVRDCLDVAIGNRKNALVLDFFAGSGTTLHASALLNAADGGQRQCILVTNNEVDAETAQRLTREGHFRGEPEYERHGIFEQVTRPRCEAVLTGIAADGTALPDDLAGFRENLEFFELDYIDPDDLDLGRNDDALIPLLWLSAGAIGPRDAKAKGSFSMPKGSRYAVLFEEKQFRAFSDALRKRPDVTHVWLITDSMSAFSEMRARLPSHVRASMLYRDYLRSFRLNVEQFT